MRSVIEKHATDLIWSLWTELGVPGVIRNHAHVAIDPEPLLVVTPLIAQSDARLVEQASRWCSLHGAWLASSRVQATLKRAQPATAEAFRRFTASVPEHAQRWVGESSAVTAKPKSMKRIDLPLTRPALARFRLRALCGVGARADVIAELMARCSSWLVASDFEHLGHTKRNVATILAELTEAGFTRSMAEKNALAYQMPAAGQWSKLVHATDLCWPPWSTIFELVLIALRLDAAREKSDIVRRVAATKAAESLTPLCDRLHLARPPPTTGDNAAFELTLTFTEAHLAGFAAATSPAMRGDGAALKRAGQAQSQGSQRRSD